jgi:hypothetical protein
LIAEATGKVLDVTETGVVKAAETAMSIGAWAIPFCYRMDCHRRIGEAQKILDDPELNSRIVRGIGDLAMLAHCGEIPVETEVIQNIAKAVGPRLHGKGYKDEFDPHSASLLEYVAPLHETNE